MMPGPDPEDDQPFPHVEVLRIGHRPARDKRITTHVALVARAFLAKAVHIDKGDPALEETVNRTTEMFGGDFKVATGVNCRRLLSSWGGTIVHLTMYGMPLEEAIGELPLDERLLVVVGSEKVPREVYDLAHFNVSVTNQPHSEVSALSLFLDRVFAGRELRSSPEGGKMIIVPTNTGKKVVTPGESVDDLPPDAFGTEWPPVPDERQCFQILKAIGCSRPVLVHSRAVLSMGLDMVKTSRREHPERELGLDMDLLRAGLVLHDLGRARTHSIRHVVHGARLARRLGLDERLVRIIHNHPGAGIPRDEAPGLGLPLEDFVPMTLEEKLVCHADNLIGYDTREPVSKAIEGLEKKGAIAAARRMRSLHLELEEALGIDIDALVLRH